MAAGSDEVDWTARTGIPVSELTNTFKLYVGEPSIAFRLPKGLARKSSLIAEHLEDAARQPRVESYLRMTLQHLQNILRSDPFVAEKPSDAEATLRIQHAKHKIVWRLFKTVLLQLPTELEHTRADIYWTLLYHLSIRPYNPQSSRRDVADFYLRPKLAALEAGDDLRAFNNFIREAYLEANSQLLALKHQTPSDGLLLRNEDPVIAAVCFRALWTNKIQLLEDDGQLRPLTWWELIDLANFTKHMGAHVPLQSIRDELPKALDAEPDTDLVRRHMLIYRIEDPIVLRLCELELTKRKMKQLSVKESEDDISEDEDWEVIEHPQLD